MTETWKYAEHISGQNTKNNNNKPYH